MNLDRTVVQLEEGLLILQLNKEHRDGKITLEELEKGTLYFKQQSEKRLLNLEIRIVYLLGLGTSFLLTFYCLTGHWQWSVPFVANWVCFWIKLQQCMLAKRKLWWKHLTGIQV